MTTIEDIAIDLIMAGADRGALVREETAAQGPGVMVLVEDVGSASQLVTALLPLLEELGAAPVSLPSGKVHTGIPDEQCTLQTPVKRIFEHCDQSPRNWLTFGLKIGTLDVTGWVFVGDDVCRRVAAICNAHRCPCSLDPKKAAPGYLIEKVVQR